MTTYTKREISYGLPIVERELARAEKAVKILEPLRDRGIIEDHDFRQAVRRVSEAQDKLRYWQQITA